MIIFDDTHTFESFGLKPLIEHDHPLNAEFESKTLKIPGRDGLYDFGSEINSKPFSATLDLTDDEPTELQYKLRQFVAFLYDIYGKPRTIKAAFDYDPEKYYMVKLNSDITPNRMIGLAQIELPFIAYDPYAYSQVLADEVLWGSTVITFQSNYLLGRSASDGLTTVTEATILDILVDGLAIKPIIEITGSATNLVLSVNGYTLTLGTFAGSTWLINCDKYTVLKDGVSAFGSVTLREFVLLPGANVVTIGGTGLNFAIHIKARDKYI